MDIQELIIECGNFETRKTNNRAPNVSISQNTLDAIECDGITSEQLDTLGVPVLKYKTQITLHGEFPALDNGYVGGYKSLIVNQNKSLGVKYNAVDYAKKERIYEALRFIGWQVHRDSSEWIAYQTGKVYTSKEEQEQLLAEIESFKTQVASIDTSLFFGSVKVVVLRIPWIGIQPAILLSIGAVYANNVDAVISNVTGQQVSEIDSAMELKRIAQEKKDKEDSERYERERVERAKKEELARVATEQEMSGAGLVKITLAAPTKGLEYWYIRKSAKDKYDSSAGLVYRVRVIFKQKNSVMSASKDFDTLTSAVECLRNKDVNKGTARAFKVGRTQGIGTVWQLPRGQMVESQSKISTQEQTQTTSTNAASTAGTNGVTVRKNESKNGIEIVFTNKPAQGVCDALKSCGFRFSFKNTLWYKTFDAVSWNVAQQFAK